MANRRLVFGLKAALYPAVAIEGVLFELLEMEIALEISELRRDNCSTTQADAGPIGRAALDTDALDACVPLPPAPPVAPRITGLDDMIVHLASGWW